MMNAVVGSVPNMEASKTELSLSIPICVSDVKELNLRIVDIQTSIETSSASLVSCVRIGCCSASVLCGPISCGGRALSNQWDCHIRRRNCSELQRCGDSLSKSGI